MHPSARPSSTGCTAEWRGCQKCALARTRTQVVVGIGPSRRRPDVRRRGARLPRGPAGRAVRRPGRQGARVAARTIGLSRPDVYIANVLKCRPPGNRDPQPDEIDACEGHLFAQVELIRPRVICTLGNFATKLLSGQPHGITRVHGRAQPRRIGGVDLVLYPIFHPAAALYTPAMMDDAARPTSPGSRSCSPAVPAAPPAGCRSPWARRRGAVCRAPSPSPNTPSWVSSSPADDRADRRGRRRQLAPPATSSTSSGELGAGKTVFVRGACRGARRDRPVTSPTYTVGNRYSAGRRAGSPISTSTARPACHVEEWADLEPYFDGAVCFVEWPERRGRGAAGRRGSPWTCGSGRAMLG